MTAESFPDLPLTPDERPATVKVGDLLIDESTGEVIEWPAGVHGDRIEHLTRLLVEAQQAQKVWEDACNAYKHALSKLLLDAGLQSVRTPFGTPGFRSRTVRTGRPERVADAAHRYELAHDQVEAIWSCASALDARRLQALAEAGAIPVEVLEEIVEVKTTSWIQVTPARPAPPAVERPAH